MHRFYQIDYLHSNSLSEQEAIHASRVLRLKDGDQFELFDGNGNLSLCRIVDIKKKSLEYAIEKTKTEVQRSFPELHLAVAPTKNIDRFEWFLEKATEIGLTKITPIITSNSERKQIKPERLDKIIVAACKQSQRIFKPVLMPITNYRDFIEHNKLESNFIAHCEDREKTKLIESLKLNTSTIILIGPEGDFNSEEIDLAITKSYNSVSLSESRLRTETAAIVACHTFQIKNA